MRQITKAERLAIKDLKSIAHRWPSSIMLFSHSGTLVVVDSKTYEVLESDINILNDGGDPGTFFSKDGREYLDIKREAGDK